MLFSKKTIVLAFENYNFRTNNSVLKVAEMFGFDNVLEDNPGAMSMDKKIYLMRREIYSGALKESELRELIEYLIQPLFEFDVEDMERDFNTLIRSLAMDGFSIDKTNKVLIKKLPSEVLEAKEEVFLLLEKNKKLFSPISNRMIDSLDSFRKGDYKTCILDLRLTTETIVKNIAEEKGIHLDKNSNLKSQNELRKALGNTPVLDKNKNLVRDDSKGLFNGLYNYLSSFMHVNDNIDQTGEIVPTKEDALLAIQITFPLIRTMIGNLNRQKID